MLTGLKISERRLQPLPTRHRWVLSLILLPWVISSCFAINITIDYVYDTNPFFDTQVKKDALQAVADRYSSIITTSLSAVSLMNDTIDPRIGFSHPGSGASWDVSPATSTADDAIFAATNPQDVAEEYRGPWSIAADDWILYAGGRSISSAGIGGTGTGFNFSSVFADGSSVLNRGFRAMGNFMDDDLPVWGGAISFDNDGGTTCHFDHMTAAPSGSTDFYSIALHEIGHVLGMSSS